MCLFALSALFSLLLVHLMLHKSGRRLLHGTDHCCQCTAHMPMISARHTFIYHTHSFIYQLPHTSQCMARTIAVSARHTFIYRTHSFH